MISFRKKDFIFNEEIFGLIKFFQDKTIDYYCYESVRNRKRTFTLEEFYKINRWMIDFIKGLVIDRVYFFRYPSKGIGGIFVIMMIVSQIQV